METFRLTSPAFEHLVRPNDPWVTLSFAQRRVIKAIASQPDGWKKHGELTIDYGWVCNETHWDSTVINTQLSFAREALKMKSSLELLEWWMFAQINWSKP